MVGCSAAVCKLERSRDGGDSRLRPSKESDHTGMGSWPLQSVIITAVTGLASAFDQQKILDLGWTDKVTPAGEITNRCRFTATPTSRRVSSTDIHGNHGASIFSVDRLVHLPTSQLN